MIRVPDSVAEDLSEEKAVELYALADELSSRGPIPNGTYDDVAHGRRVSIFRGYLTALWDTAHFETKPLGTYPELPPQQRLPL